MQRWRAFCEAANLTSLGLWLGVVVMAGAAAGVLFPTMKNDVAPLLPAYEAFDHSQHWLIAGGYIGEKIFLVADVAAFICGTIAIASLVPLLAFLTADSRHPPLMLRCLGTTLAATAYLTGILWLTPRMNTALRLFREAAQAGDAQAAAAQRAVFDQGHEWATMLMGGTALCLLLALIAGAWSAVTTPTRKARGAPTKDLTA